MTRTEAVIIARAAKSKKAPPLQERFWSKVDISGPNDCWPWNASVRRKDEGYGAFWMNGRHHPSARIAWLLTYGEIKEGLVICHKCDNPGCCNPCHLFVGTPLQNNDDKVFKKRHAFGDRVNTAKLTDNDVKIIRSLKPIGRARYGLRQEIANRFDIKKTTVSDIWMNRSWRHINACI